MKTRTKKLLCVPDTHFPYHDKRAWHTILRAIETWKPDEVIHLGDAMDFYSVSSHSKNPRRIQRLATELQIGNTELDTLQLAAGNCTVVFLEGNHETRLARYLAQHAAALDGLLEIPDLLKLESRKWEFYPYQEVYSVGKWNFVHDLGKSGLGATKSAVQDFGGNVVIGHTHRAQVEYMGETRPRGKTHCAVSSGWVGDYSKIDYRSRATARKEWQHAFTTVRIADGGEGFATLHPIFNGMAEVEGELVKG